MYILSPNYSRFLFFFSPPAAGLTNRGPVRDSDPGAPLGFPTDGSDQNFTVPDGSVVNEMVQEFAGVEDTVAYEAPKVRVGVS